MLLLLLFASGGRRHRVKRSVIYALNGGVRGFPVHVHLAAHGAAPCGTDITRLGGCGNAHVRRWRRKRLLGCNVGWERTGRGDGRVSKIGVRRLGMKVRWLRRIYCRNGRCCFPRCLCRHGGGCGDGTGVSGGLLGDGSGCDK